MTQRRTWRRIGWMGLGLVLVAGIVLGLVLGTPRPSVEVGPVVRETWERVLEENGRARVRDRFVVSSPLGGLLERPELDVGDCVARGDALATVHSTPAPLLDARSRAELEARREAAEAGLASARTVAERANAARSHAEDEVARARTLERSGALPRRDLEHAELEAALARRERSAARFAVDVAAHELEMIRASLESDAADTEGAAVPFVLRAPLDGCVLRVHQENEAVIPPGTPIVELADPAALEVVVDLLSTDAVRVTPGSEVTLHGFGAGEPIRGRVRLVEPTASVRLSALGVEEERVDVIVDPLEPTEGWARIGDGYRVDVRFTTERIEDTLTVPTGALFREGERWAAFVVEPDGRARRVEVEVERYGPLTSAVASGLVEGAHVVVEPPDDLRDGDGVEARLAPSYP